METSSGQIDYPCWAKYCDISTVAEGCKENLRLQQEKDDLKSSFIQSVFTRRYLEYLGKDRKLWPSMKETGDALTVATKERQQVKEAFEEEKDKIKDTIEVISTEYHNLQEKKKLLEDKMKVFEEKKAMFETKMSIKPEVARPAVDRCKQAIARVEKEIQRHASELSNLERSMCDLQNQLRSQRSQQAAGSAEQMLQGAKRVLTFMESVTGVEVGAIGPDSLELHFQGGTTGMNRVPAEPGADDFSLTLTVYMQARASHLQITGVKANLDGFKIQDLVDVAIATNDLPYLVQAVKDRWIHHFPLLSEIDILNKNHAIDWIEEQSKLRVLVGKCGRVMFTLEVPRDYPTSRRIVLLDSYGVDSVDQLELPNDNATLLQWVTFLETKYGDCE